MTTKAAGNGPKPPREKIPQIVVLQWLQKNHPELHATAELDRAWVWITADLSSDTMKSVRESIKHAPGRGFVWAKKGGHKLPSGNIGTWGHSCDKPMPFKRKGKGKSSTTTANPATESDKQTETDDISEALAFAMGQ